jgi:transposase
MPRYQGVPSLKVCRQPQFRATLCSCLFQNKSVSTRASGSRNEALATRREQSWVSGDDLYDGAHDDRTSDQDADVMWNTTIAEGTVSTVKPRSVSEIQLMDFARVRQEKKRKQVRGQSFKSAFPTDRY